MPALHWPATPIDAVLLASRLIVPLCAAIVLAAVALNFFEAQEAGQVAERKKSPVETGSMLAFFAVVYLLIRFGIGTVRAGGEPARVVASVVGAAAVVVGCAVNIGGRVALGANWANQVTVYRGQTMVTRGVFGYVRHPLYASLIWMSAGASLVYANAAAVAATFLLFVPAMSYRARQEEALLERRFPAYPSYCRHVPRFFPRSLKGYRDDRV
jgi:protein-S-isoprenylcysteine O-methyltransferase Ste14